MGENQAAKLGATRGADVLRFSPDRFILPEDQGSDGRTDFRPMEVDPLFVENIFWLGILQAVQSRRLPPERPGALPKLELVFGRKRVRAARVIVGWFDDPSQAPSDDVRAEILRRKNKKLPMTVPTTLAMGTELDLFSKTITENEQREGTTPRARALQYNQYLNLGGTDEGAMKTFRVSAATLKNWRCLLECSESVQTSVDREELTLVAAIELSTLPFDQQERALEQMKAAGTTRGAEGKAAAKRAKEGKEVAPERETTRARSKLLLQKAALKLVESKCKDCMLAASVLAWALGEEPELPPTVRKALDTASKK